MADMAYRLGSFRIDHAGVMATFKSGEMQGALREVAEGKAAEANAVAAGHHVNHEPVTLPAYEANVAVGHSTALGFVNRSGPDGFLDQAIYHTLDSVNH